MNDEMQDEINIYLYYKMCNNNIAKFVGVYNIYFT